MASKSASIEHGELVRQWKWPLRTAFWILTITLFVWVFTLAIQWYWAQRDTAVASPTAHAQAVLQREVSAIAELQPGVFAPVDLAARLSTGIHDSMIAVATAVARVTMNWPSFMRRNAAGDAMRDHPDPGGAYIASQLEQGGETWRLIEVNTDLFAVRTVTYLCALPLAGVLMALAAVDGFVARAKRRAAAGRESASIYHRAKLGQSFVAIMAYIAYLGLPEVSRPDAVLLPIVGLLAVLLRLQCAYYKKYV